jgi:hypothetical protein
MKYGEDGYCRDAQIDSNDVRPEVQSEFRGSRAYARGNARYDDGFSE